MSDFDYSGYGLFESLASDQSAERAQQRKALVTAQARIEDNLGRFFKAAKSAEEFGERYSLVQQEFLATIREAASEFGARPETIATTIFAHYQKAADVEEPHKKKDDDDEEEPEPIEEPDETDDSEEEDFDKDDTSTWHSESSVRTACSCGGGGKCSCDSDCDCVGCDCCGGKKSHFLGLTADGGDKGTCSECDQEGFLKGGVCGPCRGKKLQDKDLNQDQLDRNNEVIREQLKASHQSGLGLNQLQTPMNNGSQAGTPGVAPVQPAAPPNLPVPGAPAAGPEGVAGMTGQAGPQVQPPGVQQLQQMMQQGMGNTASLRWAAKVDEGDTYDSDTEKLPTADNDGNTNLDGPSPKIDKGDARKPGEQGWSTDEIDVPSKKHPTVHMDPTVVLPRENVKNSVKDDVKGIGESVTEVQTLPTATNFDDSGFAGPNQEQAPHTDTWGNDGQTTPVSGDSPLETVSNMRWAARVSEWGQRAPEPPREEIAPENAFQPQLCQRCGGQGCGDCGGTGKVPNEPGPAPRQAALPYLGPHGDTQSELDYLNYEDPISEKEHNETREIEDAHMNGAHDPHGMPGCPWCEAPPQQGDPDHNPEEWHEHPRFTPAPPQPPLGPDDIPF